VSFVPFVGTAKDAVAGVSGRDPISGVRLNPLDRLLAAAPVITHALPVGQLLEQLGCFPVGTPISTRHGDRPIEDIRPGDEVLSADPYSGTRSYQKVRRVYARDVSDLTQILLGDDSSIITTPEHPFWVEGSGFVEAGQLRLGDRLPGPDSKTRTVRAVVKWNTKTRVYNFEVEGNHTYFASGALVHNICWWGRGEKHLILGITEHVGGPYDRLWRQLAGEGIIATRIDDMGNMKQYIEEADWIHFTLERINPKELDNMSRATSQEYHYLLENWDRLYRKVIWYHVDKMIH
jgi:hypothetical protein